ncbi:MAG TPA: thiamine phosphate synthase [Gemmatimonadaceae bacterium]|nr:thiamine phosphate synthase [Gemmatimonadaceae bacterium]
MLDPATLTLLAITDDLRDGPDGLVARAAAAVRGGASMLQVRLKHVPPRELVEVARRLVAAVPVPVLVNDRLDVALAAGAAGVHLGVDDLPVAAARRLAPTGFIVGASFGGEEELAHAAGADYVGIGPVFGTPSKLDAGDAIGVDGFVRLRRLIPCPAVAIGGVSEANAAQLMAAGADGIAVIRAVLSADDPEEAARRLRAAMRTVR